MTQCASGHGLRLHMQDAGRCGASGCLETSPPPQLSLGRAFFDPANLPQCPPWFIGLPRDEAVCSMVARLCRRSGTTEPFTRTGKRFSLLLSSSGGGLFDGRPKTQTWVWGAFVSSPGGLLRSQASSGWLPRWVTTLDARNSGELATRKKPQSGARKQSAAQPWVRRGGERRGKRSVVTWPVAGQCPFGCANPKACTSSAQAAVFPDVRSGRRTKCHHPRGLQGF